MVCHAHKLTQCECCLSRIGEEGESEHIIGEYATRLYETHQTVQAKSLPRSLSISVYFSGRGGDEADTVW